MIRVYLDMDGVLADFDKRAIEILGVRPRDFEDTEGAQALWDELYSVPDFFYSLDPMPDCHDLVRGVQEMGFHPTILTGIPKRAGGLGAKDASTQKRAWVKENLGSQYEVITCPSKDKCLHMEKAGDVLIDDWGKWQHRWEYYCGKFILHSSASESLLELATYRLSVHDKWFSYS